jgi:5-(carboxyamino)imidazole ribonucleotide synthase
MSPTQERRKTNARPQEQRTEDRLQERQTTEAQAQARQTTEVRVQEQRRTKAREQNQRTTEARVIAPGSTIGVLGGGQLGRMLALAGRAMGYRFVTLDPTEDSPCGQVADRQITASYDDHAAAAQLAELADVITYEFENVDAKTADMLAEIAYVPQGGRLLYTTQHRLREKRALEAAGVPVAPYREIAGPDDLRSALEALGVPCVLKTATGGYDGKGQRVIRTREEAEDAYAALRATGRELVLEQFVRFDKEISVIAARSPRGEVVAFPPAENIHVDNILHLSIAPARIPPEVAARAESLARQIAEALDVVGLIAVEMFLAADGRLYVNELAPRPHNSGHYTMEACRTSQFEQHIRAVCNLPLGPVELMSPVVMVNLLGQHVEPALALLTSPKAAADAGRRGIAVKLHLYGKKEAKIGRKMGHLNVLAPTVEAALEWIRDAGVWEKEQRACGLA